MKLYEVKVSICERIESLKENILQTAENSSQFFWNLEVESILAFMIVMFVFISPVILVFYLISNFVISRQEKRGHKIYDDPKKFLGDIKNKDIFD